MEQLQLAMHGQANSLLYQLQAGQVLAAQTGFAELEAIHQQLDACFAEYK